MFNNNGKSSLANKTIQVVIDGADQLIEKTGEMNARFALLQDRLKTLPKGHKGIKDTYKEIAKLGNSIADAVMNSDELIYRIEEMGKQGKISKEEADGLVRTLKGLSTTNLTVAKTTEEAVEKQKELQSIWRHMPDSIRKNMKQLRMDIRETGAEFAKTFIEGGNEGLTLPERVGDAWNDAADTVFQFGGVYGYAIGLAMKALTPFVKKVFELSDAQKDLREVTKQATESIAKETIESTKLFNSLNDVNITEDERSRLISEINGKYGDYLPNLLTEKSSAEDIAKAYDSVTKALKELAIQRSQQAVTESIFSQQAEKELNIQLALAREQEGLNKLRDKGVSDEDERVKRRLDAISKYRKQLIDINATTVQRLDSLDKETEKLREALGLQTKQELAAKRQFRANNRNYKLTVKNLKAQKEALRNEYMAAEGLVGQGLGALGIEVNAESGFEEYFNELLKRAQEQENRQKRTDDYNKKSSEERNRLLDRQLDQFKLLNENLQKAFSSAEGAVGEAERKVDEFATEKELNKALVKADKEILKLKTKINDAKAEGAAMDSEEVKKARAKHDAAKAEFDLKRKAYDLQKKTTEDANKAAQDEYLTEAAKIGRANKAGKAASQDPAAYEYFGYTSGTPQDIEDFLDANPALKKQVEDKYKKSADYDPTKPISEVIGDAMTKALKRQSVAVREKGKGTYRPLDRQKDADMIAKAAVNAFATGGRAGIINPGDLYTASGGFFQTERSIRYRRDKKTKDANDALATATTDLTNANNAYAKAKEEFEKFGNTANAEAEEELKKAEERLDELQERREKLERKRADVIAKATADEAKDQADLAGDKQTREMVEKKYETYRNYLDVMEVEYQEQLDATAEEIRNKDSAKKLASLLNISVEELVTSDGSIAVIDYDKEDLKKMGASDETIEFFEEFSETVDMQYEQLYEENLKKIRASAKKFVEDLKASLPEEMRQTIEEARVDAESARLKYERTAGGIYEVGPNKERVKMSETDVVERIQELNTQMENASGKKLKELTAERDQLASMVLKLLEEAQAAEMEALKRSSVDIIQEIRNRAGEDGWSEAKIKEETELAMRDARNKVEALTLRQSNELEALQNTLNGTNKKGFDWDSFEQDLQEASTKILSITGNIFNSIGSIRDYFIDALNASIDTLTTKMDALESESDRIASKISELEDDLVGKRSGRRDAILQALEQERLKEEEVAKAKIGLAEELAKKEKELADQERARAKEQLYMDLARAISNVALGITNALASSGLLGIIQGVAIGAAGAVQTGIIAKQIGAFAEGGFTGNGEGPRDSTGYKQAGVVHEGEWVAPKWMVNSPSFGSVIQSLESSRQRGFADGGMVSADYNGMSNAVNNNTTMQRQMNALMGAAIDMANRPTYVSVTDINNVNMKQAKRVKASRIGG